MLQFLLTKYFGLKSKFYQVHLFVLDFFIRRTSPTKVGKNLTKVCKCGIILKPSLTSF